MWFQPYYVLTTPELIYTVPQLRLIILPYRYCLHYSHSLTLENLATFPFFLLSFLSFLLFLSFFFFLSPLLSLFSCFVHSVGSKFSPHKSSVDYIHWSCLFCKCIDMFIVLNGLLFGVRKWTMSPSRRLCAQVTRFIYWLLQNVYSVALVVKKMILIEPYKQIPSSPFSSIMVLLRCRPC